MGYACVSSNLTGVDLLLLAGDDHRFLLTKAISIASETVGFRRVKVFLQTYRFWHIILHARALTVIVIAPIFKSSSQIFGNRDSNSKKYRKSEQGLVLFLKNWRPQNPGWEQDPCDAVTGRCTISNIYSSIARRHYIPMSRLTARVNFRIDAKIT